jgi:hypothetical protein
VKNPEEMRRLYARIFHSRGPNYGQPMPAVVLSHAFWRNQFGGDSTIIGRGSSLVPVWQALRVNPAVALASE